MDFNDLSAKFLDHLRTVAKTETVIGEQFGLGEFTCVPVIKISMGFGSGGGTGNDPKDGSGTGGGTGGGVKVEPIGFLVTKGDEISMVSVENKKSSGLSALFDKMPEMMDKAMKMKEKKENE